MFLLDFDLRQFPRGARKATFPATPWRSTPHLGSTVSVATRIWVQPFGSAGTQILGIGEERHAALAGAADSERLGRHAPTRDP